MRSIDEVIENRAVRALYQPLVNLASGAVVGYEALARGPEGSAWERPEALFAAAREAGRVAELDWVCRAAAYAGALDAGLGDGLSLFVNTEPEALGVDCPADLRPLVDRAERALPVVSEMTERALARDPGTLLAAVAHARAVGWGIALDDVGADPASLALMPFVHPDVIKLDLSLVQEPPTPATSAVAGAVMAQAERTGALVLAEGVETDAHRRHALALGATLGQGWMYGRPGPLPAADARPRVAPQDRVPLLTAPVAAPGATPFELISAQRPVREGSKELLLPLSRHLERRAADRREPPVVLSTFQEGRHFTPRTRAVYEGLAASSVLVAAMAQGIEDSPARRVRGTPLAADDALAREWDVVVVGPHFAAALVALDRDDGGPDRERRFDFCVTYDRDLALAAARALLLRVVPPER